MRRGVLVNHHNDLPTALKRARQEFARQSHCRGFTAEEVHLNPGDIDPAQTTLDELPVVANEDVPQGHLRLCTHELTIAEEMAVEKTVFTGQVEAARRGLGAAA